MKPVASIIVPVLPVQACKAWPKWEQGGRARPMTFGDALTQEHRTDAHTTAYRAPLNERRLDVGALEHDRLSEIGGAVVMQLAFFDVDCAASHKALGGDPGTIAPDEWWLEELPKIARLLAAHPGLFVYRTRGGYRIVGALATPFEMTEPEHAAVWSRRYLTWVAYLRRVFGLVADPTHAWQNLFRLPHATRDGGKTPERRETIGDPSSIGTWDPEVSDEDRAAVAKASKKKPPKPRDDSKPRPTHTCNGDGVLFHVLQSRGAIRSQIEGGKWAIDCLRSSEHSSDSDTGTILYAPGEGDVLGWIKCSHSGSGHDRLTLADWLPMFTREELDAARVAAGVVDQQEEAATTEAAATTALPTIKVGLDLHRVVDEACDALVHAAGIYQRAGELVHVTRAAETNAQRGVIQGAPQIRPIGIATLRETLTRVATWKRYDRRAEEYRECSPPDIAASAVLARGEWPTKAVRPIAGVIEASTMRPDGSILSALGYDTLTGLLLAPSCDVPPVPDQPTQAEAMRALLALAEPFAQMPWAGEADRYAAVSGILTLVARAAIDGCVPGLAIDANSAGAGKSLATDVIAIIATGRPAARVTWPENPEELDKVLASYAFTGAPHIAIDNVAAPIEGGSLDKHLTSDSVEIRPLGRTATLRLPWRALITLTGNGLDVRGDTRRRVLVPRLEPSAESPEERTGWAITDLRAWCRENRGRLVAAALTVLRAYIVAGRPDVGTRMWGSFEAWAALVAPAIVFAGGVDPMGCRLRVEDDAQRSALAALLSGWARTAPHGETVRGMLAHLYPHERLKGERCAPDGYDDMRAAIEVLVPTRAGQAPDVRRLGEVLRRIRGKSIAGLRIDQTGLNQGRASWKVGEVGEVGHSQPFAGDVAGGSSSTCSGSAGEKRPTEVPHPPRGQTRDVPPGTRAVQF